MQNFLFDRISALWRLHFALYRHVSGVAVRYVGFATATRHRGGDPDEPGPEANGFLAAISGELLPTLAAEEGPLLWTHGPFVAAPDLVGVEGFVGGCGLGSGHPPEDRRALARACLAKALWDFRRHGN